MLQRNIPFPKGKSLEIADVLSALMIESVYLFSKFVFFFLHPRANRRVLPTKHGRRDFRYGMDDPHGRSADLAPHCTNHISGDIRNVLRH